MGNEQQIRAAALVLLVAVAVISYLHWGKGVDAEDPPTPTVAATPSAAGTDQAGAAQAGNYEGAPGPGKYQDFELPEGGGFAAGQQGKKGEEGLVPTGEAMPEQLWGDEGGTSPPKGETSSSQMLCLAGSSSDSDRGFDVSGKLRRAPGVPASTSEVLLVAVDKPISKWEAKEPVAVHWVGAASGDEFSGAFKASGDLVYICALGPTTHKDVQLVNAAGCLDKPLQTAKGNELRRTELEIHLEPLDVDLLVVGAASLAKGSTLGSRVKHTIAGKVQATGVQAGEFFVVAAPAPILDQQESLADPSAFSFVGADGRFDLSLYAAPSEPLFVCAMALPKSAASGSASIEGQGCMKLQVPQAPGTAGSYDIVGTVLGVNAEKMPLAPHETQHLDRLRRCGTAGT